MADFVGFFFELGSRFVAPVLIRDVGLSPMDSDNPPVYRVYGPDGILHGVTGACTLLDTGSITGATNAVPIVYTCANHGLTSGFVVTVVNVTGNLGANAKGIVTVLTANTFSLAGTTGTGAYVSGGSWHLTGLYTYTFTASGISGFEAGNLYVAVIEGAASSIPYCYSQTFQIN